MALSTKSSYKYKNAEEIVLNILRESQSPLSSIEIAEKTQFSARTVRYILKKLQKKGIVKKIPNLLDMRRCFYKIST
ncbi:MAG: winged helix-turn-helix transcriptional regulator [Candidatus Asgardarchaeia archaeon]